MAETTKMQQSKRLDAVDIAKFVMSIFIVCLHINPFGEYRVFIQPLLRTAVPLFFLISAYFFFRKQRKCSSLEEKVACLQKYVTRNLQLYAFWFVVLLAPTLWYRDWFADGVLYGLFSMVNDFMFQSTFIASWYIMASIIATVMIVVMSRYMSNKTMLMLFVPVYVVCCLMTNYCYAPLVESHIDALRFGFGSPYNSFWVALFWVQLGKMLAENEERMGAVASWKLAMLAIAGLAVLAAEQLLVVTRGYAAGNDCFFALPLICVPVFALLLRVQVACSLTPFMRAASVVTYCVHDTLAVVLWYFFGLDIPSPVMVVLALAVSWSLTSLILKLETRPQLHWLKYAH